MSKREHASVHMHRPIPWREALIVNLRSREKVKLPKRENASVKELFSQINAYL